MRPINPFRILLSLLLFVGMSWICYDRLDDLQYFFSKQQLLPLGDVLNIKSQQLHDNQYIEVTGILGNRAASVSGLRTGSFRVGTFQIRHLLGSPIFIEFDQEKNPAKGQAYTRVKVQGRLTDFGPKSEMKRVRQFFESRLKMTLPDNAKLLIMDEKPGQEWRYPLLFGLALLLVFTSFWFTFKRF